MKTYTIEEYKTLLKNHDWFYEYSDDYSVWEKGTAEKDKLLQIQKQIDPTGSIWNSFAPKECQLTTKPTASNPPAPNQQFKL
jgi:hypothetical protein